MTRAWLSVLVLALVATGAFAQNAIYQNQDVGANAHYGWANVLSVNPVYAITSTNVPSQQCYQQPVVREDPGNSTASTLLGAVVGGVLGHTIGRGEGRVAATVAGAVAGGAVGNHVSDPGGTYQSTQTECQQVNTVTQQRSIVGYNVEYRYHGDVYMSRLSYDPGDRLRVLVSVTPAD